MGISFGAPFAIMEATTGAVDAVVLFYGASWLEPQERVHVPVQGHFADDDPYEPDGGQAFFDQLRALGTPVEYHRYPGTHHWFFEPSNAFFQKEAADLAWSRTLSFLRTRLQG